MDARGRAVVGALPGALATLAAALASMGVALALAAATGVSGTLAVTAVANAFFVSRAFAGLSPRRRAAELPVFAALAIAGAAVGLLLVDVPLVGAPLFALVVSGSVAARRFGPRGRRLARLVAAPFLAVLVVPAPVAATHGALPVFVVPLIAILTAVITAAALSIADVLVPPPAAEPEPAARPRSRRTGVQPSTRAAVQMLVTLLVCFAIGFLIFPEHWAFLAITGYIVVVGARGRGDAAYRAGQRLAGALAGTVAGALIALPPLPTPLVVALILLLLTAGVALRAASYVWWAAALTASLALLYDLTGVDDVTALGARIIGVLIGGVVAVLVTWFLLPVRSTDVLRARLAEALAAAGDAAHTLREQPADFAGALPALAAAIARLDELEPPHRLHGATMRIVGGRPSAAHRVIVGMRALEAALVHAAADLAAGSFDDDPVAVRRSAGALERRIGQLRRVNGRRPVDDEPLAAASGPLSEASLMLDGLREPIAALAARHT